MAEFVKIVKIAQRMCKDVEDCEDCPLLDEACAFAQNMTNTEILQRVERKVLQWANDHRPENSWYQHIEDGEWFGQWECGKCGQLAPRAYNYCPGCGQKMEGEADAE